MKLTEEIIEEAIKNLELAKKNSEERFSDFQGWKGKIETLSNLCQITNKTFIAALGTAILAKTLDSKVNPFALKSSVVPNGYSARGLCQHALAANAPRLEMDLGVTGREPLNNQPFFAKDRIHKGLPVKDKKALDFLLNCLSDLEKIETTREAQKILTIFVGIRKRQVVDHSLGLAIKDSKVELLNFIEKFVSQDSEHGKRAQAVVAGLLSCKFENVEMGKIHDPDKNFPGDVVVRNDEGKIILSVEIRDKLVKKNDIYSFSEKLIKNKVNHGALVAVAEKQEKIIDREIDEWLEKRGLIVYYFFAWQEIIDSALFWNVDQDLTCQEVLESIFEKSKEIEVNPSGMALFKEYV